MLRLPMRVTTVLLSAIAFAGCASLAGSARESANVPKLGNEVSGTELTATGATTVYDALVRTRRQYFAPRGATTMLPGPTTTSWSSAAACSWERSTCSRCCARATCDVVRRLSAVDTYYKYGNTVSVGGLEIELVNE